MTIWTVHLEGGPRRVNHAAVCVGHLIYSFGGYCTGENYTTTATPIDVHVLDTRCYRWRALPTQQFNTENIQDSPIPYQRYGHTAVLYKECAYIWGGRNDDRGASNILHEFKTGNHQWSIIPVTGQIPGPRDGHSACVIRDKMYIFGGYEEYLDVFSNDVHEFNFTTGKWRYILVSGSPARWRDFQSATGIGNIMYIFGGRGDREEQNHSGNEVYCNKLYAFDTQSYTWYQPKPTGAVPAGRRSHSAFNHKNELYIFGGYNGVQDIHFSDIYKFNPPANKWSLVKPHGDGPCPRRRQCCCVTDNRVFLFGGTSPSPSPLLNEYEQNLMDHDDLFVLDFTPSLKTLCLLNVIQHKLDCSCLPRDVKQDLTLMTTNNLISRPLGYSG